MEEARGNFVFFSFYTFSLILFLFVYFRLRHFEWYSLFPCLFPCCLISITISTWNLSCDTQKKCQLKHFSFIFWVPHSATFFFCFVQPKWLTRQFFKNPGELIEHFASASISNIESIYQFQIDYGTANQEAYNFNSTFYSMQHPTRDYL